VKWLPGNINSKQQLVRSRVAAAVRSIFRKALLREDAGLCKRAKRPQSCLLPPQNAQFFPYSTGAVRFRLGWQTGLTEGLNLAVNLGSERVMRG
jgi:hypothetical protein